MLLCSSYSNAQTIDPTTGNLITSTWQGTTPIGNYNGFSGGGTPGYIANQKAIVFGYNQGTASQSIGIANALSAAGSGIEVKGYNYSWYYYNNDANRGALTGNINLTSSTGTVLETYKYNMPQTGIGNWIQQSGSQTFASQYQIGQVSTLDVSFTGKDDRWWAGYYGPAIKSINVNLSYGVNPCATNPAYSPNCDGFSNVLTSSNLVPNPNGYAVYGDSINQSYAINTALATAGSAAQIHGFQWGYVANANGPYCALWAIVCFDERTPSVSTNVNITNSSGASLYNVSRNYQNSYNTTNYSYLFPSSQTMSTLGTFNLTASTNDVAYVGSMWSKAIYTADPCAANPLLSPTCSGYGAAYAKLMASTTTTTSTAPTSTSLALAAPTSIEASPTSADPALSSSGTSTQSAPPPAAAPSPAQDTAVAQSDPAQPSPTQAGPSATTPQPAGGPPQTTTASVSSSSSAGPSASAGPSKLAMSVLKSAQEKDKATQNAAVQNAAKAIEGSTQQSQATATSAIASLNDMSANSASAAAQFSSQTTQSSQQAAQLVDSSQQASKQQQSSSPTSQGSMQSATSSQAAQSTQTVNEQPSSTPLLAPQKMQETQQNAQQALANQTLIQLQAPQRVQEVQSTSVSSYTSEVQLQQPMYTPPAQQTVSSTSDIALKPPTPPTIEPVIQSSSGTGLTIGRTNVYGFNIYSLNSSASMQLPVPTPSPVMQFRNESKMIEIETLPMQISSFSGSRAGNPLSDMMQQRFELMQNNAEQRSDTVKKDVQSNELAGGVDIASMATQPKGFESYSVMIKDATFYEPKEVYKGQTVVDNARALRQMGSDRLHKAMVDSQYKLGE